MTGPVELGSGVLLGFSLAAPPGPMNALIAVRATRSYGAGLVTAGGALTADAILGLVVFTLGSLVDLSRFVAYVYSLGGVVMVLVAILLLRDRPADPEARIPALTTYSQALAFALRNPFQIVWWLTAGIAFAYVGGAWLFAGLFGAIGIWIVTFPWLVHRGSLRFPSVRGWIKVASAAVMLGFAAYLAVQAALVFRAG